MKLTTEASDNHSHINSIAYKLTSLYPKDWNDATIEIFRERLFEIFETVNTERDSLQNDFSEKVVTQYYPAKKKQKQIEFWRTDISPVGKMVLNALIHNLRVSGKSLSTNEKWNIINELKKELMDASAKGA